MRPEPGSCGNDLCSQIGERASGLAVGIDHGYRFPDVSTLTDCCHQRDPPEEWHVEILREGFSPASTEDLVTRSIVTGEP